MEERWNIIGPEVTVVMQNGVIPEVVPFDATLETPIDDQKYVLAIVINDRIVFTFLMNVSEISEA